MQRRLTRCAARSVTVTVFLTLCGCSSDRTVGGAEQPVGSGPPGDVCDELAHVCHYVDFGSPGDIHECHALGHNGPEARCIAESDRCTTLCRSAAADVTDTGANVAEPPSASVNGSPDASFGPDGGPSTPPSRRDAGVVPSRDAGLSPRQKCTAIANRCHAVDPGSGPIHECHDLGHDESPGPCERNYERCLALCTP
jgi:hypothetical protein